MGEMKTILVINDGTPQCDHAAQFALIIAQKLEANIIMADACVSTSLKRKQLACIEEDSKSFSYTEQEITGHLMELNNSYTGFRPEIKEMDISSFNEVQLAELTIRDQIWLVVKGMADHSPETLSKLRFNVNILLNRSRCPVLLVPYHWSLKPIERLVYIADLRYCRLQFIRFLAELAKPWLAIISIANLAAKGLPSMNTDYATAVFNDEICANVAYDKLLLNNIRETDMAKAVDVIINGMHNDILVMVNHRFHFEEIVGRYITEELPDQITVPLLIFPY